MIILASNSPRRKELLSMLGYEFQVKVSNCDENSNIKNPKKLVKELSLRKAKAIESNPSDIIIGSDTVVAIKNKILGKPKDFDDAYNMLKLLSGKTHTVYTGIAVLYNSKVINDVGFCKVKFKKLSRSEIIDYIKTSSPYDKAGAYAIQDKAAGFIEKIKGDYYSVVGFPCCKIDKILKNICK